MLFLPLFALAAPRTGAAQVLMEIRFVPPLDWPQIARSPAENGLSPKAARQTDRAELLRQQRKLRKE